MGGGGKVDIGRSWDVPTFSIPTVRLPQGGNLTDWASDVVKLPKLNEWEDGATKVAQDIFGKGGQGEPGKTPSADAGSNSDSEIPVVGGTPEQQRQNIQDLAVRRRRALALLQRGIMANMPNGSRGVTTAPKLDMNTLAAGMSNLKTKLGA